MEFERDTIISYETAAEVTLCQEETLESIVPDACPDILRIVDVCGQATISGKQAREGVAQVTGMVRASILYQPEGGGGLRRFSPRGDGLAAAAPFWPRERIIFMPQYTSWHQRPEVCTIIFDGYEPKAFGFSRCGNYMAVGTSSEVDIFRRTGE